MIEEFLHPFNNSSIPFVLSLGYRKKKRQIQPLPQKFKRDTQRVTYVCNQCLFVWLSSACAPGRQRHNPAPPLCVWEWAATGSSHTHTWPLLPKNRRERGREKWGKIY